ncbi:MAG: DUF502 domain-containing protein [Kiritimatiellia bacterium]
MKQLLKSIRAHILIGGVLVTPVAVTLWIILLLVNLLSSSKLTRWLTTPIFGHAPDEDLSLLQALLSLGMVLGILFVIGLIFRNFLGRRAYNLLDKLMEKTPVINRIYTFVRTVSESILSQKETMFREVVLIEYPHPGCHAIAFITAQAPSGIQEICNQPETPHVFVFLPTTPNPTSGFLLAVPKSQVKPLKISTSEAMRLIISAGASGPGEAGHLNSAPTLLEKLDHMIASQRRVARPPPEPRSNLNYPRLEEED